MLHLLPHALSINWLICPVHRKTVVKQQLELTQGRMKEMGEPQKLLKDEGNFGLEMSDELDQQEIEEEIEVVEVEELGDNNEENDDNDEGLDHVIADWREVLAHIAEEDEHGDMYKEESDGESDKEYAKL